MRWLCKTAAEILFFFVEKISFENKKEMSNLDSKTANYFAKMAKTLLAYFFAKLKKICYVHNFDEFQFQYCLKKYVDFEWMPIMSWELSYK